jgi:hypothetical protein
LARTLHRLAELTAIYAGLLLRSPDIEFEALSRANAEWAAKYMDEIEASRLRERAQIAWREKDWRTVADCYQRILDELHTVSLQPSEQKKLVWARHHESSDR